ncbi:MAG TPA: DUF2238 domain-containing protein, partial [Nitrospirota bacterium]|nr:DUF2238 domain-containing protein [Nitrospirota bacterium]
MSGKRLHLALLALLAGIFVWSAVNPHDFFTWLLEVLPAVIGAAILIATFKRFRFTPLVYTLMAGFMVILMVGGHYTYALAPPGFWMEDVFGFHRNHYDRIGHFFQGFVPAMISRELLIRKSPLRPGGWLFFLVVCVALAISASYEFVEWGM